MNDERHGIDALRESVETVAADLERRGLGSAAPAPPRRRAIVAGGVLAAAVAVAAVGVWLLRPAPTPEVEILELKIDGRPVRAVVVEDRPAGTLVVMPKPGEISRRDPIPGIEVALLSRGER